MHRAVVVGAGPNGLAAALRLARAGWQVTLVEAAEEIGGALRSGALTPGGPVHDLGASAHPLAMVSPALRGLGTPRSGAVPTGAGAAGMWRWADFDLAHPLDDGRVALVTRGRPGEVSGDWAFGHTGGPSRVPDVSAEAAASLGPDARRWRRLIEPVVDGFPELAADVLALPRRVPRRPVRLARFGLRAALPATVVARRFVDAPAAALWTGLAAHGFGRLDRPLTSAAGLLLGAAAHFTGWPVAAGGSAAIVETLSAQLVAAGVQVRTGYRVDSYADLIAAVDGVPDAVLLATGPQAAACIAGARIPARITRALGRYRYGPAAFVVHYELDRPVPWTAKDCGRAAVVHLGGTAAQIAEAERDTAAGRMPESPFVLVSQQHVADPGRIRAGRVPIQAYAHVPHGYGGDAATVITAQIERFAPGFAGTVLERRARGPALLQRWNANLVGGDIAGGATAGLQLLARPRLSTNPYQLGGRGLYLCSASTPPGGGVHGMSGWQAAGLALADQRRMRR